MTGYRCNVISITVKQDTPAGRFVNANGTLGGTAAISLEGASLGSACPVLLTGTVEVEIASGQSFAALDNVSSDAEGKAVKITDVRTTPVTAACIAMGPAVNGFLPVLIK